MCGRFTYKYTWKQIHRLYNIHNLLQLELEELRASFNASPGQVAPVIRTDDQGRRAEWMRWGLTPSWSKDGKPGPINAKSETLAVNGMFRAAFAKRRCIVPVSGFYEWKQVGPGKQPYYIHPADPEGVLSLAGVWEFWRKGEDGEPIVSFTVITTSAGPVMSPLHDRSPVILTPAGVDQWLDRAAAPDDLKALLTNAAESSLAARPVSRKVNSPRNNGPELIEAIAEEPEPGPAREGRAPEPPTLFG